MRTSFLFTLFLIGCAGSSSTGIDAASTVPAEITLRPGESRVVDGLTIDFDSVTGDSRCPVDVTCAWEGDAVLRFTLSAKGMRAQEVELHTSRRAARDVVYGEHRLTLLDVAPARSSEREIARGDYRATVRIERADAPSQ